MKNVRVPRGKPLTAKPAAKVQVVGKPQSKPARKQSHADVPLSGRSSLYVPVRNKF
jgi:hypothetical protein